MTTLAVQPEKAIDAEFVAVQPPAQFFGALRPAERVALMTEMADAARDVIDKRGWVQKFQSVDKKTGEVKISEHIEVGGWQFIGALGRASAKVVEVEEIDGGYRAKAVVVSEGQEVGSGWGYCTRKEWKWKDRDPYALAGMAQTRAVSRAFRHIFGFIAELAGYSATPAEEVPPGGFDPPPKATVARPPTPGREQSTLSLLLSHAVALGVIKTHETANLVLWANEHGLLANPPKLRAVDLPKISQALDALESLAEDVAPEGGELSSIGPKAEEVAADEGPAPLPPTSKADIPYFEPKPSPEEARAKKLRADVHILQRELSMSDEMYRHTMRRLNLGKFHGFKDADVSSTYLREPELLKLAQHLADLVKTKK